MLGEHLCEKHQNKIREEFIISSTTHAVRSPLTQYSLGRIDLVASYAGVVGRTQWMQLTDDFFIHFIFPALHL
jgi:hypothetical protein